MMSVSEIGLPELSPDDIERLTEKCEAEITRFIFKMIPRKSVSEFTVICSLELSDVLTLDLDIDLSQKYDTGHNLEEVLDQAAQHAQDWLEARLLEMKSK